MGCTGNLDKRGCWKHNDTLFLSRGLSLIQRNGSTSDDEVAQSNSNQKQTKKTCRGMNAESRDTRVSADAAGSAHTCTITFTRLSRFMLPYRKSCKCRVASRSKCSMGMCALRSQVPPLIK